MDLEFLPFPFGVIGRKTDTEKEGERERERDARK